MQTLYREGGDNSPMRGISEQSMEYMSQEYIEVHVVDDGVLYMKWNRPIQETQTLNSDVELLPFEDIMKIFRNNIFTDGSWHDKNNTSIISRDVLIDIIKLGYVQLRETDAPEKMSLVPAWMFYGKDTQTFKQREGQELPNGGIFEDNSPGQCYLCINAVDGSVIDVTE